MPLTREASSVPLGERLRAGVVAGLVAAAATGGALLAFGARRGDALRTFAGLGRALLGHALVTTSDTRTAVAVVGVVVHCAALVGWGALLGVVAARWREPWRFVAAALVAIVAWVTNHALGLAVLRPGNEMTALSPQRAPVVLLYVLLALGLWLGMRVAFSRRASTGEYADARESH